MILWVVPLLIESVWELQTVLGRDLLVCGRISSLLEGRGWLIQTVVHHKYPMRL